MVCVRSYSRDNMYPVSFFGGGVWCAGRWCINVPHTSNIPGYISYSFEAYSSSAYINIYLPMTLYVLDVL